MNFSVRIGFLSMVLVAAGGCRNHEQPPPSPPPKQTVFDPMVDQLHRAQNMADKLPQERKDALDHAIDSGDAPQRSGDQ